MNIMKKRTVCLLAAILLFSLFVPSAFAEKSYFPVSEQAIFSLTTEMPDSAADVDDPDAALPECDCVILRRSGDQITAEDITGPVFFRSLLDKNAELRIAPPEGYYISSLALSNENGYAPSSEDLLSCAYGQKNGTAISLFLSEISPENGQAIDTDYVSSSDAGEYYELSVFCEDLPDEAPTVEYSSGDAGYFGQLVDGGDVFEGKTLEVKPLLSDVIASAQESSLQFTGYRLIYDNGTHVDLQPGETVSVYMDAVIEAQWKTVTPPAPDPDPDPDPDHQGI